jgi:hypothetical protein
MLMIDRAGEINQDGAKVMAELRNRYQRYFSGEEKMAPCCGNNAAGQEIMAIKRRFNQSAPETVAQTMDEVKAKKETMDANTRVRMEFVGAASAPIPYRVHGRVYRGCNNNFDRFIDALPDDVEALEMTGAWRRVSRPGQPVQVVTSDVPRSEPRPINQEVNQGVVQRQMTAAEAQRKAQLELEKIKNDAAFTVETTARKEDLTVAKALRDIARNVHVERPDEESDEPTVKKPRSNRKKTS